jgi:MoxR-like ATPase
MHATSTTTASAAIDPRVECRVCGHKSHSLLDHVLVSHGMTPAAYLSAYPGAATLSEEALAALEERAKTVTKRKAPAAIDLTVKVMGLTLPVDAAVPSSVCLPMPKGYAFPTKGLAKKSFYRAVVAIARGRNCFIWGMPGTGKDAVVHAVSALTRRPVVMVTFRPGTDLAPWFYTRSIDANGTGWAYGHLWHALTKGVEGRDGKMRAPLVLLSDVDRADSAQAEWFRILTDSISGRILGPDGEMVPLIEGVQFVCTANSCGTGDARGRMASANPMDASIMDRLGRKVEAHYMHWDDESAILRSKFPEIAERCPEVFDQLGRATKAVRKAIEDEDIYAELTHRGLCEILAEADDLIHFGGSGKSATDKLLKRSFAAWLDGLDTDSRLEAKRLIDSHIEGGALDLDEDDGDDW